jgi:hypothetical protein
MRPAELPHSRGPICTRAIDCSEIDCSEIDHMEAEAEAEAERARRVDAMQSGEEPEPEPEPQNELPHGGVSGAIIETLDGGHGTSLRAARAFAAGEIVLQESPRFVLLRSVEVDAELLRAVCEASGLGPEADMALTIASVLELWAGADEAARAAMAECFGTPDDPSLGMADFVAKLVRDVQGLHAPLAACDAEQLAHSVLVWLLSAHTIDKGAAIFEIGHRCNHSCTPNVTFQNSVSDDHPNGLVFRAIRPIECGESLQTSYLVGPELMAPGCVRRRLLETRKSFVCACSRCAAEQSESESEGEGEGGDVRGKQGQVGRSQAAMVDQQPELATAALTGTLELEALDRDAWRGHWVLATALWADGLRRLRGGVERGDMKLARSGFPALSEYFAWVRDKHPIEAHFASSHAAECYACLAAMQDEEAAVLASRLCASYMIALENEFGPLDAQNVQMRAWFRSHCGHCGKAAKSCCARCGVVSYCGIKCQKAAWKAHKSTCVVAACAK